jgi:uncharacterized protein YggE
VRTVCVTGHGEARVAPDSAVVRVAAVHRADGVADALGGADSAARQVIATAGEFTTPERIATSSVQIWSDHDQQGNPAGFRARHSLTIRCGDIDAAGGLLSALAEQVGDRLEVEGVSLEVADQDAGQRAAREAAYADAVERATQLAGLAGAELGEPQEVVEGGFASGPVRMAKAVSAAASLAPGEASLTSTVTVIFRLR